MAPTDSSDSALFDSDAKCRPFAPIVCQLTLLFDEHTTDLFQVNTALNGAMKRASIDKSSTAKNDVIIHTPKVRLQDAIEPRGHLVPVVAASTACASNCEPCMRQLALAQTRAFDLVLICDLIRLARMPLGIAIVSIIRSACPTLARWF